MDSDTTDLPGFRGKPNGVCVDFPNAIEDWITSRWGDSILVKKITLPPFIDPEDDDNGPIEYKRTLYGCSDKKIQSRATQMLWRMLQSSSQTATYYIGVEDCGEVSGIPKHEMVGTLENIEKMCDDVGADVVSVDLYPFVRSCGGCEVFSCIIKIQLAEPVEIYYDF